ncbi:MAG: sulfotransferase [Dokdonella sp.]
MKLPFAFIQLPLQFDADTLAREVLGFGPEHWREHPEKYPGNFWLPLIAADGDPDNESFFGPMRPTPYLLQSPYLMQALSCISAVWGRTRLMKLTGQAEVSPHFDINYYWRGRARVHVPVVTQPSVRFLCGDQEVNMKPGECWIFDTWRRHRVINASDVERIHLVADTVGSDGFGEFLREGSKSGVPDPEGWRTNFVAPTGEREPALRYESVNLPVVMTPWEMREHINFLFSETRPHPQLELAQAVTSRFLGAWGALWSEFGADPAGWPAYRRALNTYEQFLREAAGSLQLINDSLLANALRMMVLSVSLRDQQIAGGGEQRQAAAPADPMASPLATSRMAAGPRAGEGERDPTFDRPVFIMSPPRSGSTLLFETLAQAPDVFTIGRESHALIEGLPGLNVLDHNYDSNRLDAAVATPAVIEELRRRFLAEAHDRQRRAPNAPALRLLEKTPKNSLRVPFLAKVFPEARFVYLYRDPRETLSSMTEAWQSGRFVTYPELPGWKGLPWSLLLVPGWRELNGLPLMEIVAQQWEATTRILLDDLAGVPADRIHVARYDALRADSGSEITRLCAGLDFSWDRPLDSQLPLSRYTVTPPDAQKWRRHEREIELVLPKLQATIERAQRLAAR